MDSKTFTITVNGSPNPESDNLLLVFGIAALGLAVGALLIMQGRKN